MTTKITITNDSTKGAVHDVQVKQSSTGEVTILKPGEKKEAHVYSGVSFEVSEVNVTAE